MNADTLEKMRRMRLLGMHRAFPTSLWRCLLRKGSPPMNSPAMLVDSEWDDRYNRTIEPSLRRVPASATKPPPKQPEYGSDRGLDKNTVHRLADGEFIKAKEAVLITGPTGTGKSFLASAIGNQACLQGYKVPYANVTRLFAQLKIAKADGSSIKELMKIERQDLLILDDFGMQPFDGSSRASLLEIIEDRHGKRSTIITSQLPVKQWYDVTKGKKQ